MQFGVCWYPEQWPREDWSDDVALMRDIGFELVRIGEFAWSSYQPERDEFDWGWLDVAMDTIADAGMAAVLCTPTATPPVWLMNERPEILSVGPDGKRRAYGSRRHTCPTSVEYREEAALITSMLAERYGEHPAIDAWQVDNEIGNHDSARCWCDQCQEQFTGWLSRRYGSIETLNEKWGTAFWSQTYPDFASIRLPVPTLTSHNPSLELAHRQFASDQTIDFVKVQFEILQTRSELPVTTNFYNEDTAVDQRAAARLGGVASMDNYPDGPSDPIVTAYLLDLTRGAAGPQGEAWIMEQQPGPINWTETNPPVPPARVRVWMWQAALHGFDAQLFFRWRAARHGQEMYHSGLLRQDRSETAAVGEIRNTIGDILETDLTKPQPRVALLHDYTDSWAIEINPHRKGITHRSLQMGAYRAARRLGLEVAIVDPTSDLTEFDAVLAPALHITTPERISALTRALDAGGLVVLGPRSLVIDEHYAWSASPLPGGLATRLGARVSEHLSQPDPLSVDPWGTEAGVWTDVLEVSDAEVLARYSGDSYLDKSPAVVQRETLVYAGFSGEASWLALLADLFDLVAHPPGVEVFVRRDRKFTIDHGSFAIDDAHPMT